jgi:LmbE family N-acetylglucosaminyl deacetylase
VSTLLLVHAHPDDESILTGGVMARAHVDGHRVVLVTATRGEEGDIHNMDEADARPRLAEIRTAELREACEVLGVDRQEYLGYRDSGMTGSPGNPHAGAFSTAPIDETRDRVAAVLREENPDVVVTYSSDGTYGHPDHRMAHFTTLAAVDLLETEGRAPRKVYGHAVPRSFVTTVVEAARVAGIVLPEGLGQIQGTPDDEITTVVDVSDVLDRKLAACVAHRSQMHPGLPLATMAAELFEPAFGTESFVLLRGELGEERPEAGLFS